MMTKCHVSVKDTSQTIEEAGKTHWVRSSPPPSLVSTSSKPPGPGWGAVVKLLLANQVSVFFVQQNQRLKFDIHLLMASTFNPSGPLSSTKLRLPSENPKKLDDTDSRWRLETVDKNWRVSRTGFSGPRLGPGPKVTDYNI